MYYIFWLSRINGATVFQHQCLNEHLKKGFKLQTWSSTLNPARGNKLHPLYHYYIKQEVTVLCNKTINPVLVDLCFNSCIPRSVTQDRKRSVSCPSFHHNPNNYTINVCLQGLQTCLFCSLLLIITKPVIKAMYHVSECNTDLSIFVPINQL